MTGRLRSKSKAQRGGLIADLIVEAYAYPSGSGLARESGGSVNIYVCWADAFASKPAPTFDLRYLEHFVRLTDPLPQKSRSAASVSMMRSESLLIWLLISGAPLNHAGRSEGMPSLGEAPSGGRVRDNHMGYTKVHSHR
ncbi:hypothetical protein FRT60_15270 [Pseudomonas haemolytica]|uniref:Uncharacterized protein n=1 Tax=Pseudomonas haemolytica TaxID=2600065 RepID=A0A646NZT1_9PSED|nr:hypothetical protein [Pseudomonas haemolytica]